MAILSAHPELHVFFLGGLGIRMRAAFLKGTHLEQEQLRNHQDIDLFVFDEDLISLLRLFSKTEFNIWHTPIAGLRSRAHGEYHSVSLRDKEHGVDIGLFRAVDRDDGRVVTTNLRQVFHPKIVFENTAVHINGMMLRVLPPEWLYYMSVLQAGVKRTDGQLIADAVDFKIFNAIQRDSWQGALDPYSYFQLVSAYDDTLKKADVLTH